MSPSIDKIDVKDTKRMVKLSQEGQINCWQEANSTWLVEAVLSLDMEGSKATSDFRGEGRCDYC